jgi:hypothetical protein
VLALILANIVAVIVETVPAIDAYIGNEPYNFFDVFEAASVFAFTAEFCLRLFSIGKDREHLYSATYYATTFFGIVDTLSFAPWYLQHLAIALGWLSPDATDSEPRMRASDAMHRARRMADVPRACARACRRRPCACAGLLARP